MITLPLPDPGATIDLAQRIARLAKPGDAIALEGDLGAGKTEFARAFIRARAGRPIEVASPTFTLVQPYELPSGTIFHFDLYRLKGPEEVEELGFYEALGTGIVLIEWPSRLGGWLPEGRLDLALDFAGQGRIARLSGWDERLDLLA